MTTNKITPNDITTRLTQRADALNALTTLAPQIADAANLLSTTLSNGGKIFLCGNGGSAADSQHLAAEFIGRFMKERAPLPALALTTDTSALTAIGNDYGFEHVFSRQLNGLATPADILIAMSTSGNSENVLHAAAAARNKNMPVIALTGAAASKLADIATITLAAPSTRTDHIQEHHIIIGHILCETVEMLNT